MTKKQIALAVLIAVIGFAWVGMGIGAVWRSVRLSTEGILLDATIVKINDESYTDVNDNGKKRTHPGFSADLTYVDPENQPQKYTQSITNYRDQFSEGKAVKILFIDGSPPLVRIDGTNSPLRDLVPIGVGFIFLAGALTLWLRLRRSSTPAHR